MERLVKGDVVVIPFPFSDLTGYKRRPALVASALGGDDVILCQITSKEFTDDYSVPLSESDFKQGALPLESRIKPHKLFTAAKSLIMYKVGAVNECKVRETEERIISIIKSG